MTPSSKKHPKKRRYLNFSEKELVDNLTPESAHADELATLLSEEFEPMKNLFDNKAYFVEAHSNER
ncbi:hypothetical protein ACT3S8_18240 [Halomonas sp. AOP42-D2-25]|uniref:hypothetical protein n=1 Tax=Halomonas sp. AOP42-D2-25 TaxID=3457666 RepID=UPI004034101A